MELDARLRALAAIARQGSFSAAAAELFVSQPAVSKHIADLERHLGVKLVVRSPSGGSLTPAGEYLCEYVLRAEALLSQAARGLEVFAHGGQGVLTVASSGTPGTYLLPRVLADFRAHYPGVDVKLLFGTSEEAVMAVRSYDAELGLVGGVADGPELDVESLLDDEIVVIGHPSLLGRPITLKELRTFTWVTREEGSATRDAVMAALRSLGVSVRKTITMPSWEAVKLSVSSGIGVAACSRLALDVELLAGTLSILDVPGWRVSRRICLISLTSVTISPAAAQFVSVLRQHCDLMRMRTLRFRSVD